MKKSIFFILLWITCYLPASVVTASEFKVGFVNVQKVLKMAPQAEDARVRMEKEFAPRDRELVSLQKEIRKLEDKLVRDGAIMTEKELGGLKRDLRAQKRELKRQQDEFREDLNLRRNQELSKIQRMVLEAIQALAKKEKYDLIISDAVFAGERVDITPKVVEQLKTGFKGPGTAKNAGK